LGRPGLRKPGNPFTTLTPNPHSSPSTPEHLAQARGEPVPSRRTLASGILPSARSWETSLRHPGCARFPNAGSIGTGSPLANPDSAHVHAIEAPRREPGGRRAVGRETPLETRNPFTTNPPNPRSRTTIRWHFTQAQGEPMPSRGRLLRPSRPPLRSENSSLRHPGCARISTPLDWHGLTPREPAPRRPVPYGLTASIRW